MWVMRAGQLTLIKLTFFSTSQVGMCKTDIQSSVQLVERKTQCNFSTFFADYLSKNVIILLGTCYNKLLLP